MSLVTLAAAVGIPAALGIGGGWYYISRLHRKLAEAQATIATQAALILDYAKEKQVLDAQIKQLVDRTDLKSAADKLRSGEF